MEFTAPPNTVNELREKLAEQFARSPLTIGGQPVDPEIVAEAIEEIGDAIVFNVLDGVKPTACETIVARFFISLLERDAG